MTSALLLSALLAAEPGCAHAPDGSAVTCDAEAFRLLMDDADRTEGALNVCRGKLAAAPQACEVRLRLVDALWTARNRELELKLKAATPEPAGFLEANRAPLAYGAGLVGTMLLAFGVGLAANEAEPSLWGPLLGAGLAVDAAGAWVALSGE